MSFIENLRSSAYSIKEGKPGKRFLRYYQIRKQRGADSPLKQVGMLALGLVLVAGGFLGFLLPILPGYLLFIPGLAILTARSRFTARLLDRLELVVRKLMQRWRSPSRESK